MAKLRAPLGLLGGWLLWVGSGATAWAAPTVAQMLQFQPRQQEVLCSTPTPEEYKVCEVKLVTGQRAGSSGWLLLDQKKQPLRRFFDANGDKRIDLWSYYKDGAEVYREIDSNFNEKADQYRWLNSGGMKWGLDINEDGRIDAWKMISAEEVAQEVFQAAVHHDSPRLQALFLTEGELGALRLPSARAEQLRAQLKEAPKKFLGNLEKMPHLNDKAQFVRVESSAPQCVLAESAGTEEDLLQYSPRAILYQSSDKKHDWLHTGEMIKVGLAWRLLDAPSYQDVLTPPLEGQVGGKVVRSPADPELQKLLDVLAKMDQSPPPPPQESGPHLETVRYNLDRVVMVEKILQALPNGQDRDNWLRQMFDNLSTAAQYSDSRDKRALTSLKQLTVYVAKENPKSNLVAYGTFRLLWAEFSPRITGSTGKEGQKAQEEWLDQLSKFVQTYPKADDTPDALFHLGMGCEFSGRDEEAKRWYQQLAGNFGEHHLAGKAAGAKRRLELVGQEMELKGPLLSGGTTFDLAQSKGKVVAVYYWASFCTTCVADFAKLKQLQNAYGAKGLEVVLVNLDDQRETAQRYVQNHPVPGVHLFQAAGEGSGLNSPLALQYGIQGLPTLFLVGRDAKVINRTLQMGDLEDAIKKAL